MTFVWLGMVAWIELCSEVWTRHLPQEIVPCLFLQSKLTAHQSLDGQKNIPSRAAAEATLSLLLRPLRVELWLALESGLDLDLDIPVPIIRTAHELSEH